MGELLIGTSGYDYKEWKEVFYPKTLPHTKYLEYYAQQFNSLELNGTYYRMPTAEQMTSMIARSGNRLKFTVKAFQDITHAQDKTNYQPLVYQFKKALEPLQKNNQFLCALLQFPESFHYEKEERIYLDLLLKEFSGVPVIVEMRNVRWQNDIVYNALRQRKIGWCITDNPNLKNMMKLDYVSTSYIAYMRFHGRNIKNWYTGDNVSRYDYSYSETELLSFVEPIKHLLRNAKIVQLFFNNHAKAQAAINAKKIEMLLRE
jgi:uncharacterized protein YecE (DUF72 family)